MLSAIPLSVSTGPGSGLNNSQTVFNKASLSSHKAAIISDSLKNSDYLTVVFTNRLSDGHIVFPLDPQSQEKVVEIKNAIIVELLNKYRSKEAVLDKFPQVRDYIERSASENFKGLVDSYSTFPVQSPSSELGQIQYDEIIAKMYLLIPSFSKNIAKKSFTPNFKQISNEIDLYSGSSKDIVDKQQSILESIQIEPRSMASYSSFRASAAAKRVSGSLDRLVTQSSSQFDGGHSVNSIERAKRQYLDGIRNSAMLGFQECIILSKFFKRPMVAVKNNKVDSVFGEEFFQLGAKPIFVVNYNNYHFEGWQSNQLKAHYKPGDVCCGHKVSANRGYNYGTNDCLIGAIRADVDANQVLNCFYSNNQDIRAYLAQEHDQFSSSAAGYIADSSQFWKEQIFRVDGIDQNPAEVLDYAGINLIVTPVGKNIEDCDDSEIQRLSGDIRCGLRQGTWFECDHTGRYEQVYVNGVKGNRTQTHRRGEALDCFIQLRD